MALNIILEGDGPLYVRLNAAIRQLIARGELSPGDKLPTVRELSAELGIAGGTIRHAYDSLTRDGYVDMTQGKGTFVRDRSDEDGPKSRKKQAMDAIGGLLDELEALNFSMREIEMFFALKLGERSPQRMLTPVAVVECNQEVLSEASGQLSLLSGIELSEYLLEDVRRAPQEIFAAYRMIITTKTHYHELCSLLPDLAQNVVRMVLTPRQQTTISIARLHDESSIGIYCRSERFAHIIGGAIRQCVHLKSAPVEQLLAGTGKPLGDFLANKTVLLVSPDYLTYVGEEEQKVIRAFVDAGGAIFPYHYQIDQGSYLHIEERLGSIQREEVRI